jgi:hypothetical protein
VCFVIIVEVISSQSHKRATKKLLRMKKQCRRLACMIFFNLKRALPCTIR